MNRSFLVLVATACGLAMAVALLVFPIVTWGSGDSSRSNRAVEHTAGVFLLLATWVAAGFASLVFFKKTHLLGMSDDKHLAISFLGFKLAMFFIVALLIAGSGHGSWGVGFWLALLAGLVGTTAVFLTFNPALAKKIADATRADNDLPKDGDKKDDA